MIYDEPDFSGWATKNNLLCSDGRTIRANAFSDDDGATVPLVWQHRHDDPSEVLGHADLENRDDGVYAYGYFNDTPSGQNAKRLVQHGDVNALSIYANKLKQSPTGDVLHGRIREVSLVLAGANPGAYIENVAMSHSDDDVVEEADIFTGDTILVNDENGEEITHMDNSKKMTEAFESLNATNAALLSYLQHKEEEDKTIQDVIDTMDDDQKDVLYYLVGQAADSGSSEIDGDDDSWDDDEDAEDEDYDDEGAEDEDYDDEDAEDEDYDDEDAEDEDYDDEGAEDEDYDDEEEEDEDVKHNAFEEYGDYLEHGDIGYLSHSELAAFEDDVFADAQKCGSFRDSMLAHANEYGIVDIDTLFPDARSIRSEPDWIDNNNDWVTVVMNDTTHVPFTRIKSMAADITPDEARAKGYIKANVKKEEYFKVSKRTTDPTTVYKKQKLDRNDILDITDFDVVNWIRSEMRLKLDEEIARAILIGDGRGIDNEDKIAEDKIRPIYNDNSLYTVKIALQSDNYVDIVEEIAKAKHEYKGTGTPSFFTTNPVHMAMLWAKDGVGHRLYSTEAELCSALGVKEIVEVDQIEKLTYTRSSDNDPFGNVESSEFDGKNVIGIYVNLSDYTVGTDKGGDINSFDDFDIDYNQYKYLMETRLSGALTKPHSALTFVSGTLSGNQTVVKTTSSSTTSTSSSTVAG